MPIHRLLAASCLFALFFGCSMDLELSVDRSGAGHGEAAVTIHPAVERYVDAIFGAVGADGADVSEIPLIDTAAVRSALADAPGIEPVEIVSLSRRRIIIRFEVTDIELALAGAVEIRTESGGAGVMRALIDRTSFTSISRLFFDESSPMAAFIPIAPADFLTEDEYREIVAYILEDFMDDATVNETIDSSTAEITFDPDGTVVDVVGGDVAGGVARFSIPTIRLFTLESPIHLETHWR